MILTATLLTLALFNSGCQTCQLSDIKIITDYGKINYDQNGYCYLKKTGEPFTGILLGVYPTLSYAKEHESIYRDGKLIVQRQWKKDGTLWLEGIYQDGFKYNGKFQHYLPDGESSIRYYRDGKLIKTTDLKGKPLDGKYYRGRVTKMEYANYYVKGILQKVEYGGLTLWQESGETKYPNPKKETGMVFQGKIPGKDIWKDGKPYQGKFLALCYITSLKTSKALCSTYEKGELIMVQDLKGKEVSPECKNSMQEFYSQERGIESVPICK